MDAEPLSGMAMPFDIEAVRPVPIEPDEGRIEFLAAIVFESRAITLQEAESESEPPFPCLNTPMRRPESRP